MGAVHVEVTISNIAEPDRGWTGRFLVDTGATDCMVPRKHMEAIGIEPDWQRVYELADGSAIRFDIAPARIEFMGERTSVDVIFGNDDAEPLLGLTALESAGVEIDPANQRLKRLPAVRLKPIGR